MFSVKSCPLPSQALLQRYVESGDYTDCYRIDMDFAVTQAQFISAFYRTPIFRLERLILQRLVNKPSTDAELDLLAVGSGDSFAAWQVEDRRDNQLLLCDYLGRTRSWLMTLVQDRDETCRTRLYFGSAILRQSLTASGEKRLGSGFSLLLGFHKLYSRLLLGAARDHLEKQGAES